MNTVDDASTQCMRMRTCSAREVLVQCACSACAVRVQCGARTEVFGDGGLRLSLALDIVAEDELGIGSRVKGRVGVRVGVGVGVGVRLKDHSPHARNLTGHIYTP